MPMWRLSFRGRPAPVPWLSDWLGDGTNPNTRWVKDFGKRSAVEDGQKEEEESEEERQQEYEPSQSESESEPETDLTPASSLEGDQEEVGGSGNKEEIEDDDDDDEEDDEDPNSSDSDASDRGARPRARPRVAADCMARAIGYRTLHRYPANLDAMLALLLKKWLRKKEAKTWPGDLQGVVQAVVDRCGIFLFLFLCILL
jgi:hypothetical protein